jgi:hypothetical protein
MEMNGLIFLESNETPRWSGTLNDPDDVVQATSLSWAEKKALLASWISDARAVENFPTKRRLDSGAYVELDAIRRAMADVDRLAAANDNDGDPPPAPPGLAVSFHPSQVVADAARRSPRGWAA